MSLPTYDEAKKLLDEANNMNPGPWYDHCMYAGKAAKNIAMECGLDEHKAQVMGMLHDIGRRYGVTSYKHTIDGYNFCISLGYEEVAKICLTHSFPGKSIKEYFGEIDCTKQELEFSKNFFKIAEYDDYDRLIQLCDALALPSGFCLIEKRMVDVALRHGIHEYIIPKWKATFVVKEHFEKIMNKSIYSVLPNVIKNTFSL